MKLTVLVLKFDSENDKIYRFNNQTIERIMKLTVVVVKLDSRNDEIYDFTTQVGHKK